MFIRPLTILALTIAASLASAAPPACLLAAVGSEQKPSDLKAVCGNAASVEASLSGVCGDYLKAAMSAFSSVCSGAGVTVSTSASSPSSVTSSVSPASSGFRSPTSSVSSDQASTSSRSNEETTKSTQVTSVASSSSSVTAHSGSANLATASSVQTDGSFAQATEVSSSVSPSSTGSTASNNIASATQTNNAEKVGVCGLAIGLAAVAGMMWRL